MPLPINFLPSVKTRLDDEKALQEAKKAKSVKLGNNIIDTIEKIRQDVETNLIHKKDLFQVITDYNNFKSYIAAADKHGYIAIDTETTGLNPLVDKIVGLCLYFPGEPAAYVPINHVDYITGERLDEQLNEEQIAGILKNMTAKVIMHNAPFDIRVILHNFGVRLRCYWDTLSAAQLLDENESHRLKDLHSKYVSHEVEKTFGDYFKGIKYQEVPVQYAYLYAANDALDTYELYLFQARFLNDKPENKQDRKDLYWVLMNIEMPMVDVIVDLEENGVAVDINYLDSMKEKYHKELDQALKDCYEEIDKIRDKINEYNSKLPAPGEKKATLSDPVNISSSTQLAILFYDILGASPIKGKGDRCTDKDVLEAWRDKYPIVEKILKYREALKLTSTYIDNIYEIIHTDGRVHTGFKSNGAKTGRMSSSNPLNLQNIPSHNDFIRKMFVGQTTTREVECNQNKYTFNREEEVQLSDGTWQWVEKLQKNDTLIDGSVVTDVIVEQFVVTVSVVNNLSTI